MLDSLKAQVGPIHRRPHPPIVIVPHAGWVYSGLAAVKGVATLVDSAPKRIVIIGPSHYHYFAGFSLGAYDKYETPLGQIDGDVDLQRDLSDATGFGFEEGAFIREHSVEVIFPILQHLLPPGFKILPILSGGVARNDTEKLVNGLAGLLDPFQDAMLVSTDLSHFFDYNQARLLDTQTLEYIIEGNTEALLQRSGEGGRLACGYNGVIVAIKLAQRWELSNPELLIYYNSGDTGAGRDNVVGYASLAWPPPSLPSDEV